MSLIKFETKPAIYLSANAVDTLKAIGTTDATIQTDIDDLLNGAKMPDAFRAECLNGAEGDDVIAGWNEYADAVISAVGVFTIAVDEENNAEEFWQEVGDHGGGSFADPINALLRDGKVTVSAEQKSQLLSHLRSFAGWHGGPAHAPHPVIVTESE